MLRHQLDIKSMIEEFRLNPTKGSYLFDKFDIWRTTGLYEIRSDEKYFAINYTSDYSLEVSPDGSWSRRENYNQNDKTVEFEGIIEDLGVFKTYIKFKSYIKIEDYAINKEQVIEQLSNQDFHFASASFSTNTYKA